IPFYEDLQGTHRSLTPGIDADPRGARRHGKRALALGLRRPVRCDRGDVGRSAPARAVVDILDDVQSRYTVKSDGGARVGDLNDAREVTRRPCAADTRQRRRHCRYRCQSIVVLAEFHASPPGKLRLSSGLAKREPAPATSYLDARSTTDASALRL